MDPAQASQIIMDVSVESPGSIVRRMTVTVLAVELNQRIETRIARLAKTAKLSGFRPGKVPIKVVKSRFSDQVLAEVVDEMINTSYRDALNEKSIIPESRMNATLENLLQWHCEMLAFLIAMQ